jgi:hypothetical protein
MAVALELQCRAAGQPEPVREFRFHTTRRWKFDYAWPLENLAVEVEGGAWTNGRHTRGKGYLGDMEKYNEAALHGWTVLRVTPQQVRTGYALSLVDRALRARV